MANISIDIAISEDSGRKWIYKDLNENLELDTVQRDFSSYYDIAAVNNSLINLIRFKKGERQYNMDYGLDIEQFIYEPINTATAMSIGDRIREGIEKWEPRISLNSVDITPRHEANEYNIIVLYSIPLLGSDEYEMQYNLNGNS